MGEKVGIYAHRTAREDSKRLASRLATSNEAEVEELSFPLSLSNDLGVIVLASGDGVARSVTKKLLEKENPPVLILLPGGSQNGFYHALLDAGSTITPEQLRQGDFNQIPFFNPGETNQQLFNHFAGWGLLEIAHSIESEKLRKKLIPRETRMYFAGFLTTIKHFTSKEKNDPAMRIVLTSPYTGALKMLPEQDLYSDKLAMVCMKGGDRLERTARAGMLLFYAILGKKPPKELVQVEFGKSFEFENREGKYNRANLDGEIVPLPSRGTIFVARSKKGIRAAALKFKS